MFKIIIKFVLIDGAAPTIHSRSRKYISCHSGFRLIDTLFPVSRGQRELVIGDRQTGKSFVLVGTAIAQQFVIMYSLSKQGMSVFINHVGQRISTSVRIFKLLFDNHVSNQLCVILASITMSMTAQYISPLYTTAVSEVDRNNGKHCYVAYDDFSKHAVSFRQLCLFLRKPAGREAFPSDVFFYLHARILERSCCLNHANTLGSLMSLPVIETLSNDLSAYIATNVISITDGQLYLDVVLFGTGNCPAISIDKSVSRVGTKSLDILFRAISFRIYILISDYKQEVEVATKSDLFKIRQKRYLNIISMFVQRSSCDR